jgi:endonuclease/exonuclease/phosphatase family metal-dependent hydrolase
LIGIALALLGIGAALSSPFRGPLPAMTSGRHLPAMVVGAATLLLLGLVVNRAAWSTVDHEEVLGAELTVVTFNLQSGFTLDDEWDLARQADVIEAIDADIVLLQEVSRGWVVTSGVDQARWLSRRLDMNLVWGPSSRDGLWGLAILTRGDVLGSEMRIFDLTDNLRRGVLGAGIETAAGTLYVYDTHLDNPATGDTVRFKQATELLAIADGRPAILGGDFNAPPDSDVVATVLNAGFVDAGATLPADLTTRTGARRIDYIFVRGEVRVDGIEVLEETASDHKPVVVSLTLTP